MTTLVTGATGHLGNNLVRALVQRGERVCVLVRPDSSPEPLRGLDVERRVGDLRDVESLNRAVDGCERVYHLAALISIRQGDRARLFETNVEGTRKLLDAALKAGVQKMVHTSSFGAIGNNPSGASDESFFLDPFEEAMDYERSKSASEVPVFQAAARGLEVCIVNPSAVVGPYDFRPSLVGRTILDFAARRMRVYVPGAFDWVPMDAVVDGHIAAMERGQRGERYLLSGEVCSIDQILNGLEEFTGVPRPRIGLPPSLVGSVAVFKSAIEQRFFPHVVPRFNQQSIRLLNSGKSGDNAKARRELGFRPGDLREALRSAVHWFREVGKI